MFWFRPVVELFVNVVLRLEVLDWPKKLVLLEELIPYSPVEVLVVLDTTAD